MPYTDKEKQREYQRKRVARRRAKYLDGKKCKRCGGEEDLLFHHRDPATKERSSNLVLGHRQAGGGTEEVHCFVPNLSWVCPPDL
jgi:hypothetical protein